MLLATEVDAFSYTRAANCPVVACDWQLFADAKAAVVVTGCEQQPFAMIVQLVC
jgi:hypothetical protein